MSRDRLGYVSGHATSVVYVNGTATGYGVATGGSSSSITDVVAYTLLTFTADDSLIVTSDGLFDVLICGGGGGGSGGNGYSIVGGGGGAGAVVQQTIQLSAATYSVDIGAGGTGSVGAYEWGSAGFPSIIGATQLNIQAMGGGTGANYSNVSQEGQLSNGASGGGASGGNSGYGTNIGSAFVDGVTGKNGGTGSQGGPTHGAGGGGGFGQVGQNASGTTGGAGGTGFDVQTFTGAGSSLFKCAGGGGGGGVAGGAGGSSVGAAGAWGTASAAAANTASGGGGSGNTGSAGGSGIIYVRFKV